jgi:hypothetical protein
MESYYRLRFVSTLTGAFGKDGLNPWSGGEFQFIPPAPRSSPPFSVHHKSVSGRCTVD